MALTQAQIQTAYQNVLQRAPSASELNSYFSASQSGALSDSQVYTSIITSPEASAGTFSVVRFYQAAFGRVPDIGGLDQQVDTYNVNGMNLKAIGAGFTASTEFTNRYGTDPSVSVAYLQSLYVNVLGRTGSSQEIQGWLNAVATPGSGYTSRADVLFGFAQSSEFVANSNTGVVGFLTGAAQGQGTYTGPLPVSGNGGTVTSFGLTSGLDNLVGTSGSDIFTGDASSNPSSVQAGDSINGAAGNDTFNYFGSAGGANLLLPQLSGVENLVVASQLGASTATNLSGITDLKSVVIRNGLTGNVFTVANGVSVGLDSTGTKALAVAAETFATSATATSLASTIANGSNVTTLNLNGAALKAISIDSSGTSANTIGTLASTGAYETLTLTGAQKLTVTNVLADTVKTVNASASTGGVTIAVGTNSTDVTATGGSGNDKFAFGATLSNTDVVNGGAGTDTVSVTGGDLSSGANVTLKGINALTSVEVIEFRDAAGATTVSGASFTNTAVTKLLFNTVGADTVQEAGARTYSVGTDNTGLLTLQEKSGTLIANVALEGSDTALATAGGITVTLNANDVAANPNSVSTVNISSTGTFANNPNVTGALTAAAGSTFAVTGSQDLTIANLANKGTVDGSAFTGKLVVTGSAATDTIIGGTAADTINATTGGDTYTGNGGNDIFKFTAANQGSGVTLTTVTDFASGADKLNITAINGTPVVTTTAVDVANVATFQGKLDAAAAGAGNTNSAVKYFQDGGNTYVVVDNSAGATFVEGTDLVVKLTGLKALAVADFSFA